MAAVVSLKAVVDELQLLPDQARTFLDRQTGQFISVSLEDLAVLESDEAWDELPDWRQALLAEAQAVLNGDQAVLLPTNYEINEWEIMREFCDTFTDDWLRTELLEAIHGRGAFRNFKNAIRRRNIEQRWDEFRDRALALIARNWLIENAIPFDPGGVNLDDDAVAAAATAVAPTDVAPVQPLLPPADQLTICFAHVAYQMRERFAARNTGVNHFQVYSLEELLARIGEADVLVISMMWRNPVLAEATRLKFIQSIGAGVDQFPQDELRSRGIRLASARGVNRNAVAEHALALILAFARHIHTGRDHQHRRQWRGMIADLTQREDELGGKTLLIVGLGGIGGRLAQLAKAFDLRVLATKRNPASGPGAADAVYPASALPELLPQADFVALTCPLTPETEKIIDAAALARMKPSAYLINVARGRCVDEAALIAALQAGAIAGAGLDCAWEEPLPADSPLWTMAQVIITPHTAGETRRYEENVLDILQENLEHLWRGESVLRNQVI